MIDGHSHFTVNSFNREQNIKELKEYKELLMNNDIDKAVLSINPYIKENFCDLKHPTKIYDFGVDKIESRCTKCGNVIYQGDDYFKKYNEALIDSLFDNSFYLFLMLSLSNNTIQKNIDLFYDKYNDKISGLKLYTSFMTCSLNDIKINNYELPCLIHCSKYNNQTPSNMMTFIKNYKGNVILAHFGCLDYNAIKELKEYDNIYIDVSPAVAIYKECILAHKKSCLLDTSSIMTVNDLFYKLFDSFDIDRIIWGTDYPYSNIEEEVNAIKKLRLTKNEFEKITEKNILKALSK